MVNLNKTSTIETLITLQVKGLFYFIFFKYNRTLFDFVASGTTQQIYVRNQTYI